MSAFGRSGLRGCSRRAVIETMESRRLLSAAADVASLGAMQGILNTAKNAGTVSTRASKTVSGKVGVSTTHTVYQIQVPNPMNLSLTLTKLAQMDQVRLLYADGLPVNNGWQNLKSSTLKISQRVDPGTYYVDISHGLIATNGATSKGKMVKGKQYTLKPTDGFSLQIKGLKPDNTIAPSEPAAPTTFSGAFSANGASTEPTITSTLAQQSNFDHYQAFTTGYSLWGANGPSPDDIHQQALGDCYFLSILSDTARSNPGLIEQSIVPQSNGDYVVKFHQGAQEVDVQVDAKLPVDSQGNTIFAAVTSTALWPAIFEKAFCYFRPNSTLPGSYDGIQSGLPSESLAALGSTDALDVSLQAFHSAAQVMSTISSELDAGALLDIGTISPNGWPEGRPLPSGLFIGHAYSVVAANVSNNAIELRNPWGTNNPGGADTSGGYITISGDQLIQSIQVISGGNLTVVTPDPTPNPTPDPTPTPTPSSGDVQTLPETLGPKAFQTDGGQKYDVYIFTAKTTGQAEIAVESPNFIPGLLVAQVNSGGTMTSIGTDANAAGSDIADVTFSVTAGVTYELGVFASTSGAGGTYTLALSGNLSAPTQLNPSTTTGSISGSVFSDSNSDGTQDGGEVGSQGWTVFIDLNNTGQPAGNPTATTDENGGYTFTDLAPGTYVVRVEPSAGWSQSSPAAGAGLSVTVAASENTDVTPFGETFQATGAVAGIIYNDANSSGGQNAGEAGLAGRYVYIDVGQTGSYVYGDPWTVTDSNGNYSISGLPAGTYALRLVPTDGWDTTEGHLDYAATVQTGVTTTGADFGQVQATATLSGVVYNDANSDGTQSSGDAGLQGWDVYLDLGNVGYYVTGDPVAETDANGVYTFTGLQPGEYTVRIYGGAGWTTVQGSLGWTADAIGGQTSNGGPFGETQVTGGLFGTVYYDANRNHKRDYKEPGMQGWVVYIDLTNAGMYVDGDPYVFTNIYGGYSFTGLPPGTYIIRELPARGSIAIEGASGWSATVIGNEDDFGGSFGVR